jgi:LPS O-antigen subunit length determinant protein (WzzB/FepE family)
MTAEGYCSNPLSDEMERRIQERLKIERSEGRNDAQRGRETMAAICDGRVSALEWVLREAEVLKIGKGKVGA